MALFGRKKKEEKKADVQNKTPMPHGASTSIGENLAHILRNPRITEKASSHMSTGIYTFDISEDATKQSVAEAIRALYNVKPRKIRVVSVPSKVRRSMRTGKVGIKKGGKKAYVYLRHGESITVV